MPADTPLNPGMLQVLYDGAWRDVAHIVEIDERARELPTVEGLTMDGRRIRRRREIGPREVTFMLEMPEQFWTLDSLTHDNPETGYADYRFEVHGEYIECTGRPLNISMTRRGYDAVIMATLTTTILDEPGGVTLFSRL